MSYSPTLSNIQKFGKYEHQPTVGVLCHFIYDPKLKNSLPYYDKFPLCIPADQKNGEGFLGWNLHYVPIDMRKVILGELLKHMSYYKTMHKTLFV